MIESDDSGRLIEIFIPVQQVDLTNEILKNPLPIMGVLLRTSNEIGGMFFRTLLLRTHEMIPQAPVVSASDTNANPVSDRPLVIRVL